MQEKATNDLLQIGPVARKRNPHLLVVIHETVDQAPSPVQFPIYSLELERLRQLRQARVVCMQTASNIREDSDASEIIDELESGTVSIAQSSRGRKDLKDIVRNAISQIETWQSQDGDISGIPTGLGDLDGLTMGLQRGEMFILAARPSVGKTAMALHIANHACVDNKIPTVFFSLEMTGEALVQRLLSLRTGINGFSMRTSGGLHQSQVIRTSSMASHISTAPLVIHDDCYRLSDIRSRTRSAVKKHGVELIVVDYLQMVKSRAREREQAVAAISSGLKEIAKEQNIAVLALCQLNRGVESRDGRPRMSDLRESGSIEQDADVVSLLYRPYSDEDILELIIAKQRNGPTGTVVLDYDRRFNKFTPARDGSPEEPGGGITTEKKEKELLCQ